MHADGDATKGRGLATCKNGSCTKHEYNTSASTNIRPRTRAQWQAIGRTCGSAAGKLEPSVEGEGRDQAGSHDNLRWHVLGNKEGVLVVGNKIRGNVARGEYRVGSTVAQKLDVGVEACNLWTTI